MRQYAKIVLFLLSLVFFQNIADARIGPNDTILLSGIVVGKDTFGIVYLPQVVVADYMDPQRRADMDRLRYNVYKVYPYAITAAYVLNKVDEEMAIRTKKRDRKKYLKEEEKELNARFKGELKNLTITQGKILVKLINRQTGRDCYDVIKQLKGGLNARIYQTTAFFFNNDLKEQYDPYGEDKDIEQIVREIEAQSYLQHQKLPLPTSLNQ